MSSERILFEAVMKWYRTDPTERVKKLGDVLSYVKLALLPSSYLLGEVFDSVADLGDLKIKDLLIQAMRYHIQPKHRSSMQNFGMFGHIRERSYLVHNKVTGKFQKCDVLKSYLTCTSIHLRNSFLFQ